MKKIKNIMILIMIVSYIGMHYKLDVITKNVITTTEAKKLRKRF